MEINAAHRVWGFSYVMLFKLTSQQYAKIDIAARTLSPSQQHSFLAILAGKITRHARVARKRVLTDAFLRELIVDALHEVRAKAGWSPLQPPSGDDCVDVTAKELDRLIATAEH